ncbi:hypothetical protein BDDG_03168 [Blastomyces dermatitidis ATCC 18188]|uniref:Uncharacterized protein n=1 Tax=Ajellomyces dermatitidis (strain ATCC 18188 / CBS 674.68) TaxID=653446 RepID=F2TAG4_AJEDA|nr:hypothetical protein BDDG_03168 [Blastomyces dermatitidis ATCC 18188]EQL37383.1 hypothetical protein BDFG_01345 [Blastomyces dermatitidis ATCC 26199]
MHCIYRDIEAIHTSPNTGNRIREQMKPAATHPSAPIRSNMPVGKYIGHRATMMKLPKRRRSRGSNSGPSYYRRKISRHINASTRMPHHRHAGNNEHALRNPAKTDKLVLAVVKFIARRPASGLGVLEKRYAAQIPVPRVDTVAVLNSVQDVLDIKGLSEARENE